MKAHYVSDAGLAINNYLAYVCSSEQKQLKGKLVGIGKGDFQSDWKGEKDLKTQSFFSNSIKWYLVVPLSACQVVVGVTAKVLGCIEKIVFVTLELLGSLLFIKKSSIGDSICNLENFLIDVINLPAELGVCVFSLITQIYGNANGQARAQQLQLAMQTSLRGMASNGTMDIAPFDLYAEREAKEAKSKNIDEIKNVPIPKQRSEGKIQPIWSRICALPIAVLDVTLESIQILMQVVRAIEISVLYLWSSIAKLAVGIIMLPIKLAYQIVTALVYPASYLSVSTFKAHFQDRSTEVGPSEQESIDF